MKKLFYASLVFLTLFEIANVYFIMPMPGSQGMDSIRLAYFLYSWRWVFRAVLGGVAIFAFLKSNFSKKWLPAAAILAWAAVTFLFNFEMSADKMFVQPSKVLMKNAAENKVDSSRLVIGIEIGDEAKAYPIQFIGYHHQVLDTLGGQPIMVTYCTVCRTGRVFSPSVAGKLERFRLVGMDHFNAMFEDATTGSWWRQTSGEAIAGPLAGAALPELLSMQMTAGQWFALHPKGLVMQADSTFSEEYDDMKNYESGKSKGDLTRMDSLSWQEKSWVVGIRTAGGATSAFDWNRLKTDRIIHEKVGEQPVVLALSMDGKSFAAFERTAAAVFSLKNDTLFRGSEKYNLNGVRLDSAGQNLKRVSAYQEFWHSWRTFHGVGISAH